jgi:hypothetical protein
MVQLFKPKSVVCFILLFTCISEGVSQDFYIDQNVKVFYLGNTISPQWKNLNINESYGFLARAGYSNIKTTTRENLEIVSGEKIGENYKMMRILNFEDRLIKSYIDGIDFIQTCMPCFAKELIRRVGGNTLGMESFYQNQTQTAARQDQELKDLLYKNHQRSLVSDGISPELLGDVTDYGFSFLNQGEKEDVKIFRNAKLELGSDNFYVFRSIRKVELKEASYLVGDFDLTKTNFYDLDLMIDVFLADCKRNGIFVNKGKAIVSFEPLSGELLGLSYGINNETKIELRIDPEKWEKASAPKKWYLLYHELGHDVLNLNHGSGGKMMFNFADRGYSWAEFWSDRQYMFEAYKRMKK